MPELSAEEVTVTYSKGASAVRALNRVSLKFASGVRHLIVGPSGGGKTTLLSVLGGMMTPDSGLVEVDGVNLFSLKAEERSLFRRKFIGYVFQSFRLMRALSAKENVLLALEIQQTPEPQKRCDEALEIVGLAGKAHLTPDQLSGGEQQRVAIARAIAHRPAIVLADEPTANLDSTSGKVVMTLLSELASDLARIVIVVSHDSRVFQFADRIIDIEDGCVVGERLCEKSLPPY